MKAKNVRLFIKPWCGWCHSASHWLTDHGIRFQTLDVSTHAEARQEMRELSGQTFAPVIDVDGHILADFDTDQLAKFWKQFEE